MRRAAPSAWAEAIGRSPLPANRRRSSSDATRISSQVPQFTLSAVAPRARRCVRDGVEVLRWPPRSGRSPSLRAARCVDENSDEEVEIHLARRAVEQPGAEHLGRQDRGAGASGRARARAWRRARRRRGRRRAAAAWTRAPGRAPRRARAGPPRRRRRLDRHAQRLDGRTPTCAPARLGGGAVLDPLAAAPDEMPHAVACHPPATFSPSPPSPPITRYAASARRAGIAAASRARRRSLPTRRPSAHKATSSSPSVDASSRRRAAAGSGSSGSRSTSPPQSSGCSSARTRPNPQTGAGAAATEAPGFVAGWVPLVTTHRRAREAAGEAASAWARCSRLPTPRIAPSATIRASCRRRRAPTGGARDTAPSRAATTSARSRWKPSGRSGRRARFVLTARAVGGTGRDDDTALAARADERGHAAADAALIGEHEPVDGGG